MHFLCLYGVVMQRADLLSSVRQFLDGQGILVGAIPLTKCRITRGYLLDRFEIDKISGTAIMLAVPYIVSDVAKSNTNNVSLYAVARDYHLFFERLSDTLLPRLQEDFPNYKFKIFADHSPIDERDAAVRAGLGVMGSNGLLITEKYGSFVFLGELITNAPVGPSELLPSSEKLPTCEECGLCLAACPVGCAEGNRYGCLSALTQKKGVLTDKEKDILATHSLLWGCDLCQLACPHNQKVIQSNVNTSVEFFTEELIPSIDESIINSMSDKEFGSRAYAWRGKDTLLRNI